ncbi:MAG: PAS domain-containing protein [Alistipes sp.]
MSRYDDCSREDLIRRIEELEQNKQNTERFRDQYACKILDSLPDMVTVLDRKGSIVELVSAEETNHVGCPCCELIGKDINLALAPDAAFAVLENLAQVFATQRSSTSHHSITLNGVTHNYENRITPLNSNYALCICRDITAAEADKRDLEMVKCALNNVDEEIYACNLDGTMQYANEQFRKRHQLQGDLSQYKIYEFLSFKVTSAQWDKAVCDIRDNKGTQKNTVHFKYSPNNIVVCEVVSYLVYDHIKKQEMVWFLSHDITEQLEHENKIKEMNSVLECVLNNIPVYLFVKDPGNEFRYLYWNRAFEEHSHIPASKALGHTDSEIFPNPQDAADFRRDDLLLLQKGDRIDFVEEYITTQGERRQVNTTKSLVPVENRLPLIIGVSWDVTEQKKAEQGIIEARVRAEESDRLKSTFLANMSHEIRTPLNAIVGFAKLLCSDEDDSVENRHYYADIIDTNSDLLLQLINDILDLSKIEAGTLEFKFNEMNLNELCRSEYEIHKGRTKSGVQLIFEETFQNVHIISDHNRMAQVITNLINNAIKFTEQGQIRFGFTCCNERIEFYVRDTGVGIPEEKVRSVFDRFVKLNDFAVGSGLGLSISKMIVERMEGTIDVESRVGVGTCFHFSIPVQPSSLKKV